MKNNQRNLTGNDKIEFLVLSIEACNCLYQNNIYYIKDLINLSKDNILKISKLQPNICREIITQVHRNNFIFIDEIDIFNTEESYEFEIYMKRKIDKINSDNNIINKKIARKKALLEIYKNLIDKKQKLLLKEQEIDSKLDSEMKKSKEFDSKNNSKIKKI